MVSPIDPWARTFYMLNSNRVISRSIRHMAVPPNVSLIIANTHRIGSLGQGELALYQGPPGQSMGCAPL
jgi:hypothetical protein